MDKNLETEGLFDVVRLAKDLKRRKIYAEMNRFLRRKTDEPFVDGKEILK